MRKPAQVREWDIGKEDPSRVLSQEEWVAKKRDERCGEFAPPSAFQSADAKRWKSSPRGDDQPSTSARGDERYDEFAAPSAFQSTGAKRRKPSQGGGDQPSTSVTPESHHIPVKKIKPKYPAENLVQQEYLQDLKNHSAFATYSDIPTPDLQLDENPSVSAPLPPQRPARVGAQIPPPPCLNPPDMLPSTSNPSDIERSIDEGLLFLRQQAEKKKQSRGKGNFGLF